MSWRDQLLPASFRGVAFSVTRSNAAFGRRVVVHEYPFRDLPYVEDLGRRARSMRIEAIIVGEDYIARRDALIDAIEQSGPGRLVHPFYGELTVSLDDSPASIDESTDQGGAAQISFSVIESGEARFPSAVAASSDQVAAKSDAAAAAADAGTVRQLSISGLPAFATASAVEQLDRGLRLVQTALGAATSGDLRSTALGLIAGLQPDLLSELSKPLSLVSRFRGAIETARRAFAPADGLRAFLRAASAYTAVTLPAVAYTPQRAQERATCVLLADLVRTQLMCQAAICSSTVVFPDYNTAIATRDVLVGEIDRVSDSTTDDRLHQALANLRAAVVVDINQRAATLARVVSYTAPETLPALVVAYGLYDAADRDQDIIERNHIVHPGFIAAGRRLEVLDDA